MPCGGRRPRVPVRGESDDHAAPPAAATRARATIPPHPALSADASTQHPDHRGSITQHDELALRRRAGAGEQGAITAELSVKAVEFRVTEPRSAVDEGETVEAGC